MRYKIYDLNRFRFNRILVNTNVAKYLLITKKYQNVELFTFPKKDEKIKAKQNENAISC